MPEAKCFMCGNDAVGVYKGKPLCKKHLPIYRARFGNDMAKEKPKCEDCIHYPDPKACGKWCWECDDSNNRKHFVARGAGLQCR